MVGGLKKIVYGKNRRDKTIAIVLSQGGHSFGTTFTFNHDEFVLWQTAPRQLKVRLDAMLVYDDKHPNSLDKPVAVSPESIGGEYSCTFEVQSRSSGHKVRVKLPKRGIYALTAIDETDDAVRRYNVLIDGKDEVDVRFNYKKWTYYSVSDWVRRDEYDRSQGFINSKTKQPIKACGQESTAVF